LANTEQSGPPHDLARLIEVLHRHGVNYLLAGGAAARAYGATRLTEDADCVVSRSRENLDHLAAAMRELNARLRVAGMTDEEATRLPVQLDGDMLVSAEISTWMTDAGGFDVLPGLVGADGRVVPYEELARRENLIEGEGFTIRAAALEDIITAKEQADRSKDREALPELHAIRDARAASSGGTSSSRGSPPELPSAP
jgi:D-serine deaminase-like pyridoxal phosphate-dependent protein